MLQLARSPPNTPSSLPRLTSQHSFHSEPMYGSNLAGDLSSLTFHSHALALNFPSVHKSFLFPCHYAKFYSLLKTIQNCLVRGFIGPIQNSVLGTHYRISYSGMPILPSLLWGLGKLCFIHPCIFQALAQKL